MSKTKPKSVYSVGFTALVFGLASFLHSCDTNTPRPTQPTPSSDATLLTLTTSIAGFPGALTPGLFSYSAGVGLSTDTLLIRAAASDTNAIVLIFDPEFIGQSFEISPAQTYGPANLIVGPNILVVQVTAEDENTTLLYTLNVERFPTDSISP